LIAAAIGEKARGIFLVAAHRERNWETLELPPLHLLSAGRVTLFEQISRWRRQDSVLKTLSIIMMAGALTGAVIQSADAARRDPKRVTHVLVLGDSLSEGFGLTPREAYPALLAKKSSEAGYQIEIVNASASGGTTTGGLQRLPKHLTGKIDVLVVELGINDAFRGVPVDQIQANLQAIIDRTKTRHPKVQIVIAGMQLPISGADAYVRAFGEMFAELALKNQATLIPYLLAGVGGDPTLNLGDMIHPNAAGQRILAENVWQVLEPLIRKATESALTHVE
jgi:acyl-CoA thioesterase-1